jgi:hypothetical protein
MSPFSSNCAGQSLEGLWSGVVHYLGPTVAATVSIFPVFPGLMLKSAEQNGLPLKTTIKDCMKKSFKAAPTAGLLVGTQLVIQEIVEDILRKYIPQENCENFGFKMFSGTVVGGISAPLLAAFNGQTMGSSIIDSIKFLSRKQVGAIMALESSFIVSINATEPLGRAVKKISGDNKITECVISFISGFIGSIFGHPADTALTIWQKGREITSFSQLMKGWRIKAITLGIWMMLFKQASNFIELNSKL